MNRREKALLVYIGAMLWVAALLIFALHLTGCAAPEPWHPFGQIEPNSAQASFNHFLGGCPADTPNCTMIGGYFPPPPAMIVAAPSDDRVICGNTAGFLNCH